MNDDAYVDVTVIVGVVVALLVLAVGIFAFTVTLKEIENINYNETEEAIGNIGVGMQVFDFMGVVLVIGAIMVILGLVYNFANRGSISPVRRIPISPSETIDYDPIEPSHSGNVDITIDDIKKSIKEGKERRF